MADVQLDSITKRYPDGTDAVRSISLSIADGEFMILVGPSGCGKTTALRMIAGLEDITEGELRIGGRVVNHLPPKERDIAMVFQNYALYPHMTVRANMGFALKLAGVDKTEVDRRVRETGGRLDLAAQLNRKPANLSGGQRQRVAMGRAIVRDPQVFLMDEPLSNLDAKLRVQMRVELARLQARLGTTTVYVTHDQTEAMTLGHRVAVMRDGIIQQVDTPERLYAYPANQFVAGFIGSPPMNFLPARRVGTQLELPIGALPLGDELLACLGRDSANAEVIAGIRPEAFEDAALATPTPGTLQFSAHIDVVESMGSEIYAYFGLPASDPRADRSPPQDRGDLVAPSAKAQVAARLDATSRIRAGARATLLLKPTRVTLFDQRTGRRLPLPPPSGESPNGRPASVSLRSATGAEV